MKVKKKTLEVFTVPEIKLRSYLILLEGCDRLLFERGIKEVRLIHSDEILPDDDEIQFTVCSPEIRLVELAELRAKLEATIQAQLAKAKRGEISSTEAFELVQMEMDSSGFKLFHIEANHILTFHLGRAPRVGEKITKVELTNDGIEFTMIRV
ncbi:hypothetical protein ES708_17950 [subsurface metagenome]